MGLCLHAGANRLDRDQLAALPVPNALGSRHVVRPFIQDVELVTQYLNDNGLVIRDEAFGVKTVAGQPTQFFGALEVAPRVVEGEVIPAASGAFALTVGLRGSYDQSLPRGLAVGSRVFVCDNLAFSGEIAVHTRQTTYIGDRIEGLLRGAVARVPAVAEAQVRRFAAYKDYQFKSSRVGDAAIVELVRLGVINPSQVGKVLQEWDTPSHDEHAEHGWSAWRLHNAVTEAIKPADPNRNALPATWDRTIKLTGFLDKIVLH